MQKIEIKPYQENYKDQIIQMILKIQKEEFSFPVTLKDQPDIEDVSLFYLKGHGNFWVALSDDIIVGTLGLLDIGNSQGALRKMFVVKEYRGEGKNIAKLLLDALLERCKVKNINEIYLGTVAAFIAAKYQHQPIRHWNIFT